MRRIEDILKDPRISGVTNIDFDHGVYCGQIYLSSFTGSVVFGYDEGGFEHVSVSPKRKSIIPSWPDMCKVKDIFFEEEEAVVQIHPAKSQYIHGVGTGKDRRENVLHLWRPVDGNFARLNHD